MSIPFLNLKAPHKELKEELEAAFSRVLESGWFVMGTELEAFEAEYAAYCGVRHCIGVANGLDALHLILRAYGIQAGDEVIVPPILLSRPGSPYRSVEQRQYRWSRTF